MKATITRIRDWYRRLPARQADLVLASLVLLEGMAEMAATDAPERDRRIAMALTLLPAAGVLVRRRAPVTAVALGVSLIVGVGLLDPRVGETVGGPHIVALLLVFSMALRCEGRHLWAGVAVTVGLAQLNVWTDNYSDTDLADAFIITVLLAGGPVAVGQLTRSRVQLNRALREKAARAEEQRALAADEAVREERERIAGELHDVIAHALGAMTVQAAAARRLATGDPERAREAFRAVEGTGREALSELRRLLGVLRREDEELALSPQPRLASIGDLVARVRAAGLPTQLEVEGEPPESLPAGVDVTGYRIVQEALRSALEEGGAGGAAVRLRYGSSAIAIEVVDDGRDDSPREMLGMSERVRVYGGEMTAGTAGGEHRLRARLPLEARA